MKKQKTGWKLLLVLTMLVMWCEEKHVRFCQYV